jgi:DNA topoisomerase I
MREVAEELGNTPAVARGSYVDPRVVVGYQQGLTISAAAQRAKRARHANVAQQILEKATRMLVRRIAKGDGLAGAQPLAKTA